MMTQEELTKYLNNKREVILEEIAPMCAAFGIEVYDYAVYPETDHEYLVINNETHICCDGDSDSAVIDELIGYLFVTHFCENRFIPLTTISRVKEHWRSAEHVKRITNAGLH